MNPDSTALVDAVRDLANTATCDLFAITGCVRNAADAQSVRQGLTKHLLEAASCIMANNYNRFVDGSNVFLLATQNIPDEVDEYEPMIEMDDDEDDSNDSDEDSDSDGDHMTFCVCDFCQLDSDEDDDDDDEEEEEIVAPATTA